MRFFSDDLNEEIDPADVVLNDEGGVATAEEGEDTEEFTDQDVEDAITGVIVEGMLDGRIPCDDEAFAEAQEIGLSLGIVVNTTQGLALARDVEAEGLELSNYAKNYDKINMAKNGRQMIPMGAASRGTQVRDAAKTFGGRARALGGKAINMAGRLAKRNPVAAGAIGATAAITGGMAAKRALRGSGGNSNALIANAEARNKK